MSADPFAALPYRPCVGLMIVNPQGRVFVGKRIDNKEGDAWQMPQGGIDDGEDLIPAAMRELLQSWQAACLAVESEDEALDTLDDFKPDLLLADYRLRGERTGSQAMEAIRARLGRPIPTVIITGDTAPDRLRSVHADSAALLHKPVVAQHLHTAMTALLSEAGWRPEIPRAAGMRAHG